MADPRTQTIIQTGTQSIFDGAKKIKLIEIGYGKYRQAFNMVAEDKELWSCEVYSAIHDLVQDRLGDIGPLWEYFATEGVKAQKRCCVDSVPMRYPPVIGYYSIKNGELRQRVREGAYVDEITDIGLAWWIKKIRDCQRSNYEKLVLEQRYRMSKVWEDVDAFRQSIRRLVGEKQ